jgi:lysophospholipase L1-like esterase
MRFQGRETRVLLLLWLALGTGGRGFAGDTPVPEPPSVSSLAAEQAAACQKTAREELFVDLAGLRRYVAADAALPSPGSNERRVVFMGDSISDFWPTVDPDFFARAEFVDRGISGQTTLQMLLRFRQDVIALKPTVVHIMAGTNDIAGNTGPMDLSGIESNIASMVDLAQANGIQVVIGSVLPAAKFPWRPELDPGPKIILLNRWLKSYSAAMHLIYVDYYAALTDGALGMRSDVSADGVHPTLAGYRLMDPLALTAIRAAQRRHVQSR